jgi:hypothetical protein
MRTKVAIVVSNRVVRVCKGRYRILLHQWDSVVVSVPRAVMRVTTVVPLLLSKVRLLALSA